MSSDDEITFSVPGLPGIARHMYLARNGVALWNMSVIDEEVIRI
jgi:hypothetical protein